MVKLIDKAITINVEIHKNIRTLFFVQGVEERHYKATKWVSTQVMGMNHEEARSKGFRRLLNYITGTNENSKYYKYKPITCSNTV